MKGGTSVSPEPSVAGVSPREVLLEVGALKSTLDGAPKSSFEGGGATKENPTGGVLDAGGDDSPALGVTPNPKPLPPPKANEPFPGELDEENTDGVAWIFSAGGANALKLDPSPKGLKGEEELRPNALLGLSSFCLSPTASVVFWPPGLLPKSVGVKGVVNVEPKAEPG